MHAVTKYRFPVLMGSIILTFFTGYHFRAYLLGDIEKERQEMMAGSTDLAGQNKIKETISEAHKEYLNKLFSGKK